MRLARRILPLIGKREEVAPLDILHRLPARWIIGKPSLGAIYAALAELERAGSLRSRLSYENIELRGNRPRRLYRVA